MVIERNYTSLSLPKEQSSTTHHADVIIDQHHCVVLVALHEMHEQWDLEAFVIRLVAIGLQSSYCYIITHGIGAPSK